MSKVAVTGSRPNVFAPLRSQEFSIPDRCFPRQKVEEVVASPSAVTWKRQAR
jgi:hypothetical protein